MERLNEYAGALALAALIVGIIAIVLASQTKKRVDNDIQTALAGMSGAVTIGGDVTLTGSTSMQALTVDGALTANRTTNTKALTVDGNVNVTGSIGATGNMHAQTNLEADAGLIVNDLVVVKGDAQFKKNVGVGGTITYGNLSKA